MDPSRDLQQGPVTRLPRVGWFLTGPFALDNGFGEANR